MTMVLRVEGVGRLIQVEGTIHYRMGVLRQFMTIYMTTVILQEEKLSPCAFGVTVKVYKIFGV